MKMIEKKREKVDRLRSRFINEVEVIVIWIYLNPKIHQTLNHENILKFYDANEDKDYFYLLVEYCGGGEITNYLKERKK
jgi:serine/threonine protein kinase